MQLNAGQLPLQQGSPALPQLQTPALQTPVAQDPARKIAMHCPAPHASWVQSLPSSQLTHAAPPPPQAVRSKPDRQLTPSQQPRQQTSP
jgi:hypothetical protein